MSKENDGGPAFPVLEVNEQGQLEVTSTGMTLREYLIAHAPAEPQPWFRPVVPPKPTMVPYPTHFTAEERHEYRSWNDGMLEVKDMVCPRIREYAQASKKQRERVAAWSEEFEKQRYLQWPAAWADAMLAAREQEDG